jgi:hypothetical protein
MSTVIMHVTSYSPNHLPCSSIKWLALTSESPCEEWIAALDQVELVGAFCRYPEHKSTIIATAT